MDPKSAQISDPKLKEAYDRVMGTSVSTPSIPATPPVTAAPAHPQTSTPIPPKEPAAQAPTHTTVHTDVHTTPISAAPAATPAAFTPSGVSSGFVAPQEEKKSAVSGKLLIVAGVVFLLVYTLFWLKWFGVALPFLP